MPKKIKNSVGELLYNHKSEMCGIIIKEDSFDRDYGKSIGYTVYYANGTKDYIGQYSYTILRQNFIEEFGDI